MIARRLTLATLVSLCALTGSFALASVSARAALIHNYLSQITEVPPSSGALITGPVTELNAMTVDSGHLWVAEHVSGANQTRVDEFDASTGAFISQMPQAANLDAGGTDQGIAVGHATGEARVYVGSVERLVGEPEGRVAVFDEAGALQATWTGAQTPDKSFGLAGVSSVAADNSTSVGDWAAGDVYAADTVEDAVDVFKPEAGGGEDLVARLTGVEGAPFAFSQGTTRIAVNQLNGDLLVLDKTGSGEAPEVDVFEPTVFGEYVFLRNITGPAGRPFAHATSNLAVDGISGEIYVTEGQVGEELGAVDEFSSAGVYLGRITGVGTPHGNIAAAESVAVDPISHHVYVGDNGAPQPSSVEVFGPDLTIPDVTTEPVSNLETTSVTLVGTVDPDQAGNATCQFTWGTSTSFGDTAPCSTEVPDGNTSVEVHAQIGGLQPDTTYYYRLQASNADGTNPGEAAQDGQFTTPGPGMHGESTSDVTGESVTLEATIDPHGETTSYYFQYGTTSRYEANVPDPPGALVGSGEGDVEVARHVQGLGANTLYHYRIVVLSESSSGHLEEFDGSDQTFTTQRVGGGSPGLPDGREWELITPPEKHGALFLPIGEGLIQASADGNAMADLASQPSEAEPKGYSNAVSVLSTRGPDGWSSQVIAPPHQEGTGPSVNVGTEFRFFSEDLSHAIVQPFGNYEQLSPEATESTDYLRTDYLNGNVNDRCDSSCYQPLVTAANTPPGTVFGKEGAGGIKENGECDLVCGPEVPNATPDLSHIFIESAAPLVAGADGPYEWLAGKLRATGALIEEGGMSETAVLTAFSDDGSRSILTAKGHLYLREIASGGVVRLDAVQGGPANGTASAQYETASTDESRVFFLDPEQLTAAAGGGLYECRVTLLAGEPACDLTLLPNGSGGVAGASEDGTYLYVYGAAGLYVDRYDGTTWTSTKTPITESIGSVSPNGLRQVIGAKPDGLTDGKVSPNGQWLAFMSNEKLTDYDNRDAISGKADEEVYLYSASSNGLVCASCDPTGARPVGVQFSDAHFVTAAYGISAPGPWLAANVPQRTNWDVNPRLPRYLTDRGQLFFDSNDALVPQDVNGTQDVYEYEPLGIGDCSTSSLTFGVQADGCVNLISSGSSAQESALLDTSRSGGDVFFLTAAKLTSQDFDTALDVYDAHECSSQAPCFAPVSVPTPACSTGDSCKAAPSPQPSVFGSPPSATFSGAGNVASSTAPALKSKSLTRTQRLARALRLCKKKKRSQRSACARKARRKYGARKSGKATPNKANAWQRGRA